MLLQRVIPCLSGLTLLGSAHGTLMNQADRIRLFLCTWSLSKMLNRNPSNPIKNLQTHPEGVWGLQQLDLAGNCPQQPNYFQIRSRINRLLDTFLDKNTLSDRLRNLPVQFHHPSPRPWQPVNWKQIHRDQVVGIDPDLFCLILSGATEIEAPIRDYAQESWAYLQQIHPQMAIFMGGEQYWDGTIKSLGVWEREERQHAPTFRKLYYQLTGQPLQPKPNSVEGYTMDRDPWQALSDHLISRISTEWGAVSAYLWLMAHSTGELQFAISQPLQDEVNHLAKFWGFSQWVFANSYLSQVKGSAQQLMRLLQHHQAERTHSNDLFRQTQHIGDVIHIAELAFTFTRVMVRIRAWNAELSPRVLRNILGDLQILHLSVDHQAQRRLSAA